jgi:hypothetical protein
MRKLLVASALLLVGCGTTHTTFVHSPDTTLGRVVVYKSGVAYFERVADVQGDNLKLQVPADKVDDFLKSLTVVDADTGKPAPIAYPTKPPSSSTGLVDMSIQLQPGARGAHRLRLSYVTEAPSWKPSYRFVVGKNGKVEVQGWAIIDNTSGEDWKGIRLGVGSSSALSFRYDLQSVRTVERETLGNSDLFAMAPPLGGATYGKDDKRIVLGDMSDDLIAMADRDGAPGVAALAQSLAGRASPIVVEGYAKPEDPNKDAASLERANRIREKLVQNGVDASKVVAVGRGQVERRQGGVRIVEAKREERPPSASPPSPPKPPAVSVENLEPIGAAHFESQAAMTVPRGTSAMVSILNAETEGEVVYLYDAESPRGNASFPFRAVRVKNPTDSVLESGPVSVFGDGKFIGEGLSEPIPANSTAFVPFALDRQVLVETADGERDEIARILTVQRGVFSTEMQHTRARRFTLHNRTDARATVYVRHTVRPGYTLSKTPGSACLVPDEIKSCEKLGGAYLLRVDLEPKQPAAIVIEETTPVSRTIDIHAPGGIDMVRAFLSHDANHGPLKEKLADLLKIHADMAKVEQQIQTTREQMNEYRVRMDELHGQLVTLKAVKSAGPLIQNLEKKMADISDRLSKATIDVVGLQEKLMIARVRFQEQIAELTLEPVAAPSAVTKSDVHAR